MVLIGNEAMLPYERPPLSKANLIEETESGPKLIIARGLLKELGVEYVQGRKVIAIERAAHTVSLSDGTRFSYERLLLATGAHARNLSIPIDEGSRVATLRSYADALFLRRIIGRGRQVVVVGGGLIGLEVAASAVSRGASVTVIEAGPRLLARAAPEAMAALIKAKHEHCGVRVETDASLQRVETAEGRSRAVLADGRTFLADLVVVGIGAAPNVELAQAAGLVIDNGVSLDERLATSDPDIYGAGDCCSFPHPRYKKRLRVEAWRSAQQQGAAAAANMLGAGCPYEKIPWFWSDQYDQTLQVAGQRSPLRRGDDSQGSGA